MLKLVKKSIERNKFMKELHTTREKNAERRARNEGPLVFNKRLFAAQGSVVITLESRKVMVRNAVSLERDLTASELLSMRPVVDGLKLIHNGLKYVKDAISHVVTYESYDQNVYITKQPQEDLLSCYYILSGSVEVTYDKPSRNSMQVHESNIIYAHGVGEFLGMVSPEGPSRDLAPPATMYTTEPCEFLRIDRQKFHEKIKSLAKLHKEEKEHYLNNVSVLKTLPKVEKEKLMSVLVKQEYPAGKLILRQGEPVHHLFLLVKGRCECLRQVPVEETRNEEVFRVGRVDEGDFFGEEGFLSGVDSSCSIVTLSCVSCFIINRTNFASIVKEPLVNLLTSHRKTVYNDDVLKEHGYDNAIWRLYKHGTLQVVQKESGQNLAAEESRPLTVTRKASDSTPTYLRIYTDYPSRSKYFSKRSKSAPAAMVGSNEENSLWKKRLVAPKSAVTPLTKITLGMRSESEVSWVFSSDETSTVMFSDKDSGYTTSSVSSIESTHEFRRRFAASELEAQGFSDRALQLKAEAINDLESSYARRQAMMDSEDEVGKMTKSKEPLEDESPTVLSILTNEDGNKEEEKWHTVIHDEHQLAEELLAVNRFRMMILRKRLGRYQSDRREEQKKLRERMEKSRESFQDKLQKLKEESERETDKSDTETKEKDQRPGKLVKRKARMAMLRRRASSQSLSRSSSQSSLVSLPDTPRTRTPVPTTPTTEGSYRSRSRRSSVTSESSVTAPPVFSRRSTTTLLERLPNATGRGSFTRTTTRERTRHPSSPLPVTARQVYTSGIV
ncbi:PRKG2 [Branchiostoma lanceolatum]|uniref:PRKG2 protein n=1 Tax=Branchiostoma lanceolatum TaxID=7740 RepID=A0A8J9VS44_BRALA|nr:PRKG2 [Branchiostoma lanceolatum]